VDQVVLSYHKTRQNTAHITDKVCICRAFMRSIHGVVYRPLMDRYRPPRQVPLTDRPPGNEPFCGTFSFVTMDAVDAVDPLWDSPIAR
jgi:hypothetical protein